MSINEEWDNFLEKQYAGIARTDAQQSELQMTFFAGAIATFNAFVQKRTTFSEAAQFTSHLRGELVAFKTKIRAECAEAN